MRKNLQQIIADIEIRLATVEKDHALAIQKLKEKDARILHILRSHRASLLRLEIGDSGQLHHTGGAYTLGSRLRIMRRPRALDAYFAVHGTPKQRLAHADDLHDTELLTSVLRHGIPNRA